MSGGLWRSRLAGRLFLLGGRRWCTVRDHRPGSNEPVSGSAWYGRLRFSYARAQIDGANFHSLRHTFASRLVAAGVNIKVVQTLMGHADLTTTLRYVHLYRGDTQKAVDRLELPTS